MPGSSHYAPPFRCATLLDLVRFFSVFVNWYGKVAVPYCLLDLQTLNWIGTVQGLMWLFEQRVLVFFKRENWTDVEKPCRTQ